MRKLFFAVMCVLAASAGCRQCDSPYDYCSPVVENGPAPVPGPDGAPYEQGPYESDYAANRGGPGPQTAQQMMPANSGPRMAAAQQDSPDGVQ